MFLSLPSVLLWIGFYIATKRIMDVQKDLLGWLEEATLFSQPAAKQHQQPHGFGDPLYLCLNDLIGNTDEYDSQQKVNNKGQISDEDNAFLDFPGVSDILLENGWMDEKIDLSILDSAQDWLPPVNETPSEVLPENVDLQLGSYVDYLFSSADSVLPADSDLKSSAENSNTYILGQHVNSDAAVSIASASPEYGILGEPGLQLPSSPSGSSCSGSSYVTGGLMSPLKYEPSSFDITDETCSSPVEYCVEEVISDGYRSSSPQIQEILDIAEPVNKSKAISSGGKDMSEIRKSLKSSKRSRAPYQLKKESRYERKKVQNKEAAARYRMKRKEQDRVLVDEVEELEAEQEKLQEKHDKLKSEITYLKSLMKELFEARGLLKKK